MPKMNDQFHLIPPYCPNSQCLFHLGTEFKFYVKNGFAKTDKAPFKNQRYKCKRCKTQFSSNTFDIDFRKRVEGISENVLHFSMNGMSNNSIARLLDIAEGTVRDRIKEMSRQSIFFERENDPVKLNEDVAYDGFETFTHSQYSPCYVNTVVGSQSQFIYHNTFSPLNRKGRMTNEQKIKNRDLIFKNGPYPQDSVFQESLYLINSISKIGHGRTIFTDEHKSYQRAFNTANHNMIHKTINSKVRRDPTNPLFPINRLHMLYRQFLSSQKRETISFQKHEAALMEKIQLMKVYRNFMNPKFVKKNSFDPNAHEWSPAMYLGIAKKVLSFDEVFGVRKLKSQIIMDQKVTAFINRDYPFSRQVIAA